MKRLQKFFHKDEGSATVEMVIWFPVFVLIIVIIFNGTSLYIGRTQLWSVASDASRRVALGQMTIAQSKIYAEANSAGNVNVFISSDGSTVTTIAARSFGDIPKFQFPGLGMLMSNSAVISATSHYRIEPSL